MNSPFFWNKFAQPFKSIYWVLIGLKIILIGLFILSYFGSYSIINIWDTQSTIESVPHTIDVFNRALFSFRVDAESMFVKESFVANAININVAYSYLYLSILVICYTLAINIVSFLKKWWYYGGMLFFIFLFAQLKFELLGIFGQYNQYPTIAIIIAFSSVSYYFNSFKSNTSFIYRLTVFSILSLLSGIVVGVFSREQLPYLLITNFGIHIPLLVLFLLMLVNGIELIVFFVTLTASSKNMVDKSRLRNFLIIGLLYLTNLLLMLLKKWGVIDWEILNLNTYLLMISSMVIGIWGYKKRAHLNNDYLPFYPLGAILYLCFALVALATLSYVFLSQNQPLIDAIESVSLYIHFGFGLMAFVYTLINFYPLFNKKISITEIFYVPRRFPFFMVHIAGGFILLTFMFKNNMYPYLQSISGYYNFYGDYYLKTNQADLAKEYFYTAVAYDRYNQRSNYSLACIADQKQRKKDAQEFYAAAMVKAATPYTYLNMANLYLQSDMLLQAMFTLEDGLQVYPNQPQLCNNLGLMYQNTDVIDSTILYLLKAAQYMPSNSVATANLLYFFAKKDALNLADSIAQITQFEDIKFECNKIAVYNLLSKPIQYDLKTISSKDSISPFNYAILFNTIINQVKNRQIDTLKYLKQILSKQGNEAYKSGIELLISTQDYYGNDKEAGIEMLKTLYSQTTNPVYAHILAMWYYEQEAYELAYEYFKYSIEKYGQSSVLNCCMALCELGKYEQAKQQLQQLKISQSTDIAQLARLLDYIFTVSATEIIKESDKLKYQWIHFFKNSQPSAMLEDIAESIDTVFYKNLAFAEIIQSELGNGNINKAQNLWQKINDLPKENTYEKGVLNYTYVNILLATKNWVRLEKDLPKLYLNSDQSNQVLYWKAQIMESLKNRAHVASLYAAAYKLAPLNESLILSYVNFLISNNQSVEAYELLAKSVKQNNYAVSVLKKYIEVALMLDFTSYAQDALTQLQTLVRQDDYQMFVKTLKQNENLH